MLTTEDSYLEDWSTSIRYLCEECSKGIPHEHRGVKALKTGKERSVGVATKNKSKLVKKLKEMKVNDIIKSFKLKT